MASFQDRLRRGHLVSRTWRRVVREMRGVITTVVLSVVPPQPGRAVVATLNADEENATVQAVLLGEQSNFRRIVIVTPSVDISEAAVALAAARLGRGVPSNLEYRQLGYFSLLIEYSRSPESYSTHVLLPGRDHSKRRRHVHLTHGSGPKPDTTFRGPTNVLASITPNWVTQQLSEYKLPQDTEIIEYMPRLEIMRRSIGDTSILKRLGVDPLRPLVVWAPTYRVIRRGRETLVSGVPLGGSEAEVPDEVALAVEKLKGTLIVKKHPHDADSYEGLAVRVVNNATLRALRITTYELFGVATLVITDYSSISVERQYLGLDVLLVEPDRDSFIQSYRSLRNPPL